jgi:hypothetical protein
MRLYRCICAFVQGPRFFPNSCNEPQCKHQISGLQLSGDSAEPYFLAKRSLTGDTSERVDTRVLQAIYAFTPSTSRHSSASRSTCSSRRRAGRRRPKIQPQAYLLRRAAQRAHRCGGHRGPGRSVMDRRERPESALSCRCSKRREAASVAPIADLDHTRPVDLLRAQLRRFAEIVSALGEQAGDCRRVPGT